MGLNAATALGRLSQHPEHFLDRSRGRHGLGGAASEFSSFLGFQVRATALSRVPRLCPWPPCSGQRWGSRSFCHAAVGGLGFRSVAAALTAYHPFG